MTILLLLPITVIAYAVGFAHAYFVKNGLNFTLVHKFDVNNMVAVQTQLEQLAGPAEDEECISESTEDEDVDEENEEDEEYEDEEHDYELYNSEKNE